MENQEKNEKPVQVASELNDLLGARDRFLEAGWAYSHAIAGDGVCFDGSCFRCRLADLLFETEKRDA